jgi:phospholipase D1/2
MSTPRWIWLQVGVAVLVLLALAAAWRWTDLSEWTSPERLSDLLEPYRTSWLGLPLVLALFVVGELLLFPVLVLIFVCGLAFGPLLGPAYAMAGTLAGAVLPFFLGRWIGRRRLLDWGGPPARKLAKALDRKGLVAVFVVRKVPAPFTVINMLCGACNVSFTDFVLGTFLGMATGIVLITIFGSQLGGLISNPQPARLGIAAGVLLLTVSLVLYLQRTLNKRLEKPA